MSLHHSPLPPTTPSLSSSSSSSSSRLLFLKNAHKTKPRCGRTRAMASMNGIEPLTSSVGSPPSVSISDWNLGQKHILLLNATACAAAISVSWLFFSAIPTLLAFKRAAESMEKLLDVTTEELPDTMAAIRLSGMEISDLTMELSDIGQEITQGVRSSTRVVRLAEDRLRRLTTIAPTDAEASPTKGWKRGTGVG